MVLGGEGEEQQLPPCLYALDQPDLAFHVCGETEVMCAPATCPRSHSTINQCLIRDENPRYFCSPSSHHQVLCYHSQTTQLCMPVAPF